MKDVVLLTALFFLHSSCAQPIQHFDILQPTILNYKSDSCELEKNEFLNIYFLVDAKRKIEIKFDDTSKGYVNYLNEIGEEKHAAMEYNLKAKPDSIQILNHSKKEKMTIPYNVNYDCIAIDWRTNNKPIHYYKSCNEFFLY
jgi:uncharacterized lipoprotein YajG